MEASGLLHALTFRFVQPWSVCCVFRGLTSLYSGRGLFTSRSSSPLEASLASAGSSGEVKEVTMSSIGNVDGEDIGYQVEHPVSDDWVEPSFELASSSRGKEIAGNGGKSAMLEAFHQFQHNPQVQVCCLIPPCLYMYM